MDKDALIMEIGRLIVTDPKVDSAPWDAYALIASYVGDTRRLSGFRYRDGQSPQAATPQAPALADRVDGLRAATRVDGKDPWTACVVRIVRATGRISVDFEYDSPEQWLIAPDTLDAVAERARPA